MMGRGGIRLVCTVVLLSSAYFRSASAALFTLDFGSESIKVSVVNPRPGQSPIEIAINEMSKRKSPALVALTAGERLLSEEAAGIVARYPDRVYSRSRDMIGRSVEDVISLVKENYLPYEIVTDEERNTAKVAIHDGSAEYTVEELVAMVLGYAKKLAEMHSKTVIKDAVVSVPPYFSQSQRQALLDAGAIADVNIMALIAEHAGVALQYGIDKDFSNATKNVVFYDMGANSVYAALVHFSSYTTKDRGKNTTANQFLVKGVRWDMNLGGQTFEKRLLEHVADEFNAKSGLGKDIRSSAKAMAKLKKEVKRTKEILSANTEAPLNVESLFEDVDFRTSVTRDTFESLCADLWVAALLPLQLVLADTGVGLGKVDAVEMVGGGTRVPKLQTTLTDFLGVATLDRHLDADEALALGSSLFAANLSDGIKLNRKIGMIDGLLMEVEYQVFPLPQGDGEDVQPLFSRMKKLPSKLLRSMPLPKQDFAVEMRYVDSEFTRGMHTLQLSKVAVTGVEGVREKYADHNLTSPLRTSLHFALSKSGIVALERVEVVAEFSEWYQVPKPVAAPNITVVGNATNATVTAETGGEEGTEGGCEEAEAEVRVEVKVEGEGTGGGEEAAPVVEMIQKLRKRTVRVPLQMEDISKGVAKRMSAEAVKVAVERLGKLTEKEKAKEEMAEAKNSLEAYIYATKDKLVSHEELQKVTSVAQRKEFGKELAEAEEWLYTDGEEATTAEFRKKLVGLKKFGDKMIGRMEEVTKRPLAVREGRKVVEEGRVTMEEWTTSKPWLNEMDKAEVEKELSLFSAWLDEKEKEQKRKPLTEEPVFTSAHVTSRSSKIKDKTGRLSRIPKPRPKPKVSTPEPKLDSDLGSEKPVEDKKVDKEGSSKASESSKEEEVLRSGNEEEEHDEL